MAEEYKNEEWLREQYVEKGKTLKEIASNFECSFKNISYYCNKFDIDTRDTGNPTHPPNHRFHPEYEYEEIRTVVDGTQHTVKIHRLIAVAEYGFEKVSNADDIHHKNGCRYDNRPQNLEPLSRREHLLKHSNSDIDPEGERA
jgi:hypothetical protein